MRHTELFQATPNGGGGESQIINLPDELPLSFHDYDIIIKDEFASDEDGSFNDLEIELSPESEFSDGYESPMKQQNEGRKNKRKALVPQRALQPALNAEHSSEGSQDATASFASDCGTAEAENDSGNFDSEAAEESEGAIGDMDEKIYKGLKEETEGENVEKCYLDSVTEEWRSHWGIRCNMCQTIFSYKTEFDAHYKKTYNATPVYTCSFCNRTVEKYSTFRSHCYRHITEGRYKCKECPKGFSLQSLLQIHMLSKHTRAKPYMCEECGKSFVTKPGLKIHLKKHKDEVKEDYPCAECGKILHTRGGLTSHMNVHRLGRRFMCDVCGKTFTQKVNMQQHVKQHTGDKPFECDKCGKAFAEKSHLARHYSFHSEQRPFKCEICQKMYKTERCLKVHSMVHAKERPYICSYCGKGFLSSTKLKQHYNIHTGERPYACKYCERKFTNYPNWLKHTRRRHNVDHKTGENLPPKTQKAKQQTTPKMEPPPTPSPSLNDSNASDLPSIPDVIEPILHDNIITDFSLSKSEELILQQGLLNFPVTDEKFMLQQQVELFGGGGNLLVPYFSPGHIMQTPSTSQMSETLIPIQFIQ